MLYVDAIILVAIWIVGLLTSYSTGGLIHIFLVLAGMLIIFEIILDKEVVKLKN
jgi:hypothetical protein